MGNARIPSFIKDPDAVLDYSVDWSAWLGSDTISTSTWTVPTGLTEGSSTNDDDGTTIWLSGGTLDAYYLIVNKIITAGGRTDYRSFYIIIEDK